MLNLTDLKKNPPRWKEIVVISIIIAVIMAISLFFYFNSISEENQQKSDFFNLRSNSLYQEIESNLDNIFQSFEELGDSFALLENWRNFRLDIFKRLTTGKTLIEDTFTIGWAPIIYNHERTEFESFMTNITEKEYQIVDLLPNFTRIYAPERDFYGSTGVTNFPSPAIGIDLINTNRRPFMLNTIFNKTTSVSNPITLFTGDNGILVFTPSVDFQKNETIFVIVYVLFIEDLFNIIAKDNLENNNLNLIVTDKSDDRYADGKIVWTNLDVSDKDARTNKGKKFTYNLFGRKYQFQYLKNGDFNSEFENNEKIVILGLGTALSLLILIILLYLVTFQKSQEKKTHQAILETHQLTFQRIISYICHEIRSPLSFIYTMIYLHRNIKIEEESMNKLLDSCQQTKTIIDDVLDLQKMVEGKIQTSYSPINPIEIAKDILDDYLIMISTNINTSIIVNKELNNNHIIHTDSVRLRQLIINGLSNASKFTETGYIRIVLKRLNYNYSDYLSVEIINTGRGLKDINTKKLFIPFSQGLDNSQGIESHYQKSFLSEKMKNEDESHDNQIPKVFEESYQLGEIDDENNNNNNNYETIYQSQGKKSVSQESTIKSSGLGLPICKILSRLLGGDIILEDDDKIRATRFQFIILDNINQYSIPIIMDNEDDEQQEESYKIYQSTMVDNLILDKKFNILIIDDNRNNQLSISLLLQKLKHTSEICEDGLYLDYNKINDYDFIFLDIIMKHSNGEEIVNVIKQKGYQGLVIATTGNVSYETFKRYHQIGFDGIITKPIVNHKLNGYLHKIHSDKEWMILH